MPSSALVMHRSPMKSHSVKPCMMLDQWVVKEIQSVSLGMRSDGEYCRIEPEIYITISTHRNDFSITPQQFAASRFFFLDSTYLFFSRLGKSLPVVQLSLDIDVWKHLKMTEQSLASRHHTIKPLVVPERSISLSGSTEMLCLNLQVSLDWISVQLTVAPCSMVAELGFYTIYKLRITIRSHRLTPRNPKFSLNSPPTPGSQQQCM